MKSKRIYLVQSFDVSLCSFNSNVIAFSSEKLALYFCVNKNIEDSSIRYSYVNVVLETENDSE